MNDSPDILIPIGGGYYWVNREGGEKVQLSNKQVEEGNYVVYQGEPIPVGDPDVGEATAVIPDEVTDKDTIAELKAQLAEAAKIIDRQEAELAETKPTVDVHRFLFNDVDDVKAFYSEQHIKDLAARELATINRERMKEGFDRITYTDEEWAQAVEETYQELLQDRQHGALQEGPLTRTLKMWNPKDDSLRQIPYEGQFNNIAGSLEDGYRIYTKKGFKRTDPMLCPAVDCWLESAQVDGEMLFTGYCSEDHFQRTERGGREALPGVTTGNAISGRTRR